MWFLQLIYHKYYSFFDKNILQSKERILNTNGKTTYNVLKEDLTVKNEVIDYSKEDHKLYFLNKIISNFNSVLISTFHGINQRMLPLYYSEYEWRFNHRHTPNILEKIQKYIRLSTIGTRKMITKSMDAYALSRGIQIA